MLPEATNCKKNKIMRIYIILCHTDGMTLNPVVAIFCYYGKICSESFRVGLKLLESSIDKRESYIVIVSKRYNVDHCKRANVTDCFSWYLTFRKTFAIGLKLHLNIDSTGYIHCYRWGCTSIQTVLKSQLSVLEVQWVPQLFECL